MMKVSPFRRLVVLAASLMFAGVTFADDTPLGLGERADWMRGSWGALWLPEKNYNGNIEGVRINDFLDQIAHLKTIDYVQVALASPNIYSPVHTGPHPIIESLWQNDTDTSGDPINLVVPRASVDDPLMSWLTEIKAAGLKTQIYVNSYNLLARIPDSIPDAYPDLSERWEEYCDTNPTVQAFINTHPYLGEGDAERRKYMFCYAEFILKEYSLRYGDLIDAWLFDSADNIMEACGDDAGSGLLDDQRIYQAFADACHAGNPNAAIAFNNSVGNDAAPFATPSLFDDYAFGHPFGGAGNMVEPGTTLYARNFGICEYMQEHNGLPFVTTDDRDWNDAVVGHFFPKQSTTSWNAGNTPCLTDEQFVEWTAEGIVNGGAITWGTALVRVNMENSPVLTLQPYALTQLELTDAHLSEFQFPGVPNWRRAETPLSEATIEFAYSHTLQDGVDFWDPSGGSITGVTLVDAPSWLSVAESSPGAGEWVLSGTPTETEASEYCFELRIAIGAIETSRTVDLIVNEPPILATESRTISGGADWLDSGLELTYDNNGETSDSRAISYSTQSYQSDGGFKLTVTYTTGNIGNNGSNNFSIGLISDDTDLSTYAGFNPFAAETNVYSLGVNLTTNYGIPARGLNFTDGASITSLDTAGTNVQFVKDVSTPVVIEVGQEGAWTYSIDGIVEATGIIPAGFDLSKNYRVAVYGQDDNGGIKSIQFLALELKPIPIVGLVADWSLDDVSSGEATDESGNAFHGTLVNGTGVGGVHAGAVDFNGVDSTVFIPIEVFGSITNEITISLWANGDAGQEEFGNSVIYATDSFGDRVLNIHLPWTNSKVYWDAGTSGGTDYDRISKPADYSEFMGRWNHWTFTKNTISGEMKVYLNGALWHSGTEKIKSISGIADVYLGTSQSGAYYDGTLDEIKLYNTELTASEVSELYESYEGYESWTTRYPSLENFELDADADQDGLTVLLEYTLNGNPLEPDLLVQPTLDASGENFVFTFTRRAESAGDTTQVFQYSSNLIDWHDLKITGEPASEVSVGDEIEGVEEVMVTVSQDFAVDGRLFGRLKVVAD